MAAEHPTSDVTLTREINYERMRPLSRASTLADLTVMRFSSEANRPLVGVHPSTLQQELAFKGQLTDSGDSVVLATVTFAFTASLPGGPEVCHVEGALMVVYRLGPDENGHPFDQERVEEFAEVNSMYHSWAYIRELVTSSAAKVGLAGVVLPIWTPPAMFPPKGEDTVLRFTPTAEPAEPEDAPPAAGPTGKARRKKRLTG